MVLSTVGEQDPANRLDLRRGREAGAVHEYAAPRSEVGRLIHGWSRYPGNVKLAMYCK